MAVLLASLHTSSEQQERDAELVKEIPFHTYDEYVVIPGHSAASFSHVPRGVVGFVCCSPADAIGALHTSSYQVLMRTVYALEAQERQAKQDLETLKGMHRDALADPAAFVQRLVSEVCVVTHQARGERKTARFPGVFSGACAVIVPAVYLGCVGEGL